MLVTTLHHIGLLLLNVYGYITDKRAVRQTKLATLVPALAWYDTYLCAPSQSVFAVLTTVTDRQTMLLHL